MSNLIVCSNCSTKNSFYELNCKSCGSILRTRVVNIDLWKTTWDLIESPVKAFTSIIQAEHKNFVVLLIILIGIKLFLNSTFAFNLLLLGATSESNIGLQFVISIILTIALILVISLVLLYVGRSFGAHTRFKDNFAMMVYANIPMIFALVIIFPLEYGIFGGHWLYFNPSPFLIKMNSAYILAGVETLFLIWQLFLLTVGVFTQLRKVLFSIVSATVITALLIFCAGFIPPYLVSLL